MRRAIVVCERTFHHLIALFCTVAGKLSDAIRQGADFCNEINDLERTAHSHWSEKSFCMKHLAEALKVNPQQQSEC
jgi:hypothetical protein